MIKIQNVHGVSSAEIDVSSIALIAGLNGSGKSSIINACHAVLTGDTANGFLKKDANLIVKSGNDEGKIELLESNDDYTQITYPGCAMTAKGVLSTRASKIATGNIEILKLKLDERAKLFSEILNSNPTVQDVLYYVKERNINFEGIDAYISKAMNEVQVNGWDMTVKKISSMATELKGEWKHITGEQWGSDKGNKWSVKETEHDIKILEEKLHELYKQSGYFEFEKASLQADADQLPDLEVIYADILKKIETDKTALSELNLKHLPKNDLSCPECGTVVKLVNGNLSTSFKMSDEEIEKIKQYNDVVEKKQKELNVKIAQNFSIQKEIMCKIKNAENAKQKLCDRKPIDDIAVEIEKLKYFIEISKNNGKTNEAKKCHNKIVNLLTMVDILSPDGVRQSKLEKLLELFNETLEKLCTIAGWGRITINGDMIIKFNDRLAKEKYISESQLYRTELILRIALAQLDNSNIILIDRADIFDNKSKGQLFKLLKATRLKAVVAMTVSSKDKAPDLKAAKLGNTYWVENGVAQLCYV
jgi:energy-coupling factor transporter ATP-binding protein EcfA2